MSAVYIRNAGQSILYEKEFREKCARDFEKAASTLKTIAVVGVAQPLFFGFNGGDEDSLRIRHILNYLALKGVAIDKDFELDAISFTNGRDFLKEDKAYDMVFVSCIPRDEKSGGTDLKIKAQDLESYKKAGHDMVAAHALAGALSDEHNPKKWAYRVAQSGAKYAISFGGQDEITSQDLCSDNYQEILPTPNRRIRGWTNRYETTEEFYGKPNDYPMLWLGMIKKKGLSL
jgi:hypothetical protein